HPILVGQAQRRAGLVKSRSHCLQVFGGEGLVVAEKRTDGHCRLPLECEWQLGPDNRGRGRRSKPMPDSSPLRESSRYRLPSTFPLHQGTRSLRSSAIVALLALLTLERRALRWVPGRILPNEAAHLRNAGPGGR